MTSEEDPAVRLDEALQQMLDRLPAREPGSVRPATPLESWETPEEYRALLAAERAERDREETRRVWAEQVAGTRWERTMLGSLYPDQHPVELAAWLDGAGSPTLWVFGNVGSGKSTAARALGAAAADRGVLTRVINFRRYLADLRPGRPAEDQWATRRDAETASLLIIDDFGMGGQAATDHVNGETYSLLEERLTTTGRRQVIITNEKPTKIEAAFDPRVVSRLRQEIVKIELTGPDRRLNDGQTPSAALRAGR